MDVIWFLLLSILCSSPVNKTLVLVKMVGIRKAIITLPLILRPIRILVISILRAVVSRMIFVKYRYISSVWFT